MTPERRLKVVRIIGRLNVGGPAIQAITLTSRLRERGYDTILIRGREGPREGSMDHLARAEAVRPVRIAALRRELGAHDVVALAHVTRALRVARPDILHTHAAKGGTIGRVAALLLGRARPRVSVHTFHGHVLEGYFRSRRQAIFTAIERALAKRTTCLVAVSDEVRDDLIRLGIGAPEQISVIRLGFELERFTVDDRERAAAGTAWRRAAGIPLDRPVVLLVARLVPIKRVDRFLRLAAELAGRTDATFVVLGDGELGEELKRSPEALALGDGLRWLGFQTDVRPALFGSDVVVQTSDNEGTPVSLIEAHAAGLPAVSTDVGGVRTVVRHETSGYVAQPHDEGALADGVRRLLDDGALARRFGLAGRAHVTATFTLDRLTEELDALYRSLLADAPQTGSRHPRAVDSRAL